MERIKSELIITTKLFQKLDELKADELAGAEKLMLSFLDALMMEINTAYNVLGLQDFEDARKKILEATERIRSREYLEATNSVSRAISLVTTSGQRAMHVLKERGLL